MFAKVPLKGFFSNEIVEQVLMYDNVTGTFTNLFETNAITPFATAANEKDQLSFDLSFKRLSKEQVRINFINRSSGRTTDGYIDINIFDNSSSVNAPTNINPSNLAWEAEQEGDSSKGPIGEKLAAGALVQSGIGSPLSGMRLDVKAAPDVDALVKDAGVGADADLAAKAGEMEKSVDSILSLPDLGGVVNPAVVEQRAAAGVRGYEAYKGLTGAALINALRENLEKMLKGKMNVGIKNEPLKICYVDGYTVGDKVLTHAGIKYGRVYMPKDMVKTADAESMPRVALALLHEAAHHLFDDSDHEVIANNPELLKGLFADMVQKSTAANGLRAQAAKEVEARDLAVSMKDTVAEMQKNDSAKRPAVVFLTVDPDTVQTLEAAIKRLIEQDRNVRIILVAKRDFEWFGTLRDQLMGLKNKAGESVIAGYTWKDELDKEPGKTLEEKALAFASGPKALNRKVELVDTAWVNSAYADYQLAPKLATMPEIRPPVKDIKAPLSAVHDVGTLCDAGELAVLAHRLVGDKYMTMSFEQLAKAIGGAEGDAFLTAVKALGIEEGENVAVGLANIPPTTSLTGTLKDSVNSMRASLIAA